MVDFNKRLAHGVTSRPTDPEQIYEGLDRQSDKGPLRPAQSAVLREWFQERRKGRDVIVKLHTGQGKTLIGLLVLQSQLNGGTGPALYLCPNNLLVDQTCRQAEEFGVPFVKATPDLPSEFLSSQSILITSVQKLFNGLTKFGLGAGAVTIGSVVVDDCHACTDAIRSAFTIRLERDTEAYQKLLGLFSADLEHQGAGTFLDIQQGQQDALLAVPYWSWIDRTSEILAVLSSYSGDAAIKFAWPLLRDRFAYCQCVFGTFALEIVPYLPPLHEFRSFTEASHRVFMSATITDDSFLIKGLGLDNDTVLNPLVYRDETWFGEKLILLPPLVHSDLQRDGIVARYANLNRTGNFGVVALTPSFRRADDWATAGAIVATREKMDSVVAELRNGDRTKTVVFANRYDGIDLPDAQCRILVIDSLPAGQTLCDRYQAECRVDSDELAARTARSIEQGLGRSVRGEKDFCVFLLTGGDLVKFVQTGRTRTFFSDQTRRQIEIGLDVAKMASQDYSPDQSASQPLTGVINQCLKRDDGWKNYYTREMNRMLPRTRKPRMLDLFAAEMDAEHKARNGQVDQAVNILQGMLDGRDVSDSERGWYIQEMARYRYADDKLESNRLQQSAYQRNTYLLKPRTAFSFKRLKSIGQSRGEAVVSWARRQGSWADLSIAVDDVLSRLQFGVGADSFECALNELAAALGFSGYRPEKEQGHGPDNLWRIRESAYVLFECKNQVELQRTFVSKHEAGQISNSVAWFQQNYSDATLCPVMVTPATRLNDDAFFNGELMAIGPAELKRLCGNVKKFFNSLRKLDLLDLVPTKIHESLQANDLGADSVPGKYVKRVRKSA
jgi:replicative superfamily II helicase